MFREDVSKYKRTREQIQTPVLSTSSDTNIFLPAVACSQKARSCVCVACPRFSQQAQRLIYLAHAHVDRAALIVLALDGRAAPAAAECASVCRPAPAGPPEAPPCPCPPP